MTSQTLRGICSKAVIAAFIISTMAIAVGAQRVGPQAQGLRYGDAGFRGEPINLNVVNADIRDILNYVTEQYGINFVIDKSVGKIPVTVNVNDVPWNVALDSIMRSQELGVQVNGTILRVADAKMLATEGEIYRAQQNNQLDASPLYTEFIRLNYARASGTLQGASGGAGQTSTGMSSSASPTGGSGGSSMSAGGGADQGIMGIVKRRISRRGSVEVDGRTNTLIVTDVRENIDAVRQLVTLLDQPEPQVEIEARIVVASRNFSRDVGMQLSALVVGPRGMSAGGGTLSGTGTSLGIPPSLPNPSINGNLGSQIANTAIGLTTGVFGTAQISMLLTAGERKGQAKVIATPRVTTLNNRSAEIKSGTKIPITTIQPGGGGGEGGGFAVATTEYVDVPLRLAVTPQITDVGTVILNVVAENSSTSTIVAGAAPAINTQSMTTQVTVPDGGTTVIGGVLADDEREGVERTPGISKIPIFGNLFKRKNVSRDSTELLFFITPRIYRPDSTGANTVGQDRPKSTTIVQPVPLGNPASNSDVVPAVQAPMVIPVSNPATQPAPGATKNN